MSVLSIFRSRKARTEVLAAAVVDRLIEKKVIPPEHREIAVAEVVAEMRRRTQDIMGRLAGATVAAQLSVPRP